MRRLIIASVLGLATPGTVVAATPVPTASPSAAPSAPLPGEVRINEFLPNPVGTDSGSEWIELANVSGHDIAAGGLVVARLSGSTLATVPAGTTIAAGSILLLDQPSGSIVNGGDTLVLKSGQVELDRVTYDGNGSEGSSWSRMSAEEGAWSSAPTPGAANPLEDPSDEASASEPVTAVASGAASAAGTRASLAAAKAPTKAAASKSSVKKLSAAGLAGLPYLLGMGLGMLYWYSRRGFL